MFSHGSDWYEISIRWNNGAMHVISHYPNQWWPCLHLYSPLGLDELGENSILTFGSHQSETMLRPVEWSVSVALQIFHTKDFLSLKQDEWEMVSTLSNATNPAKRCNWKDSITGIYECQIDTARMSCSSDHSWVRQRGPVIKRSISKPYSSHSADYNIKHRWLSARLQ